MQENTKWVLFSRRAWAWVLTTAGGVGVLLSYATPESVQWAMQPWLEFASAFGWEPRPELTERAVRGVLAVAGMVGVFSAMRAKMHPDPSRITLAPQTK